MKDVTIAGNTIENLLNTYADHKAQMKIYEEEVDFDIDRLENNAEYMYHKGCCETANNWIRCVGMSPNSPAIEKMIKEHME